MSKRWAKGKDGETKTDASDGYVPLHPVLAERLPLGSSKALLRRQPILCFRR